MKTQPKITVIIVARQGSSRLPGKALANVCNQPILNIMTHRLRQSPYVHEVIIATTTKPEDDVIFTFGKDYEIPVFRGHPEDVLKRLADCAETIETELVLEVGGDCPFVSPALIKTGIEKFQHTQSDVVSNTLQSPFTYPVGYDFIMLTKKALMKADKHAKLTSERFQPFQYIVSHPEEFSIASFTRSQMLNHWRWTLDYPEDLIFVQAIFDALYKENPLFGLDDIQSYLTTHPEIAKINAMHIDPVVGSVAWFTNSYVSEVHADIRRLLDEAAKMEENNQYDQTKNIYTQIRALTSELYDRICTKSSS
ncbi:MAG: NTP transferase domain-containing protein [Candidatus Margulisbacteria bacterium]|nr:NTP transferase domain-containing protein [Candidatus Margulisiibacteriota bacterium]